MKALVFVIGIIFAAGMLVAGCIALVNDEDSIGPAPPFRFVSHERDCWDGDCGQNYDQWRNEDRNRNRDRNRGAFSPGPFDRSPVEMHDVCVSLDCSGRDRDDRDRSREEVAPMSLFPPTPDGIRQFVVSTIKSGVEMGRLFAETTIAFVENLLIGIA